MNRLALAAALAALFSTSLTACAVDMEYPDDEWTDEAELAGLHDDFEDDDDFDADDGNGEALDDDYESIEVDRAALGISRDKVKTKVGSRTVQLRAFVRDLAIGGTGWKSIGATLKIENAVLARKRRGYEVDIKCVYFSKSDRRWPGDMIRLVEFPAAQWKSSTSDRKTTCAHRWGGIGVKVNNDGEVDPASGAATTVWPSGVVAVATVRKGSSCKSLIAKSGKVPDDATTRYSVRQAIQCPLVD